MSISPLAEAQAAPALLARRGAARCQRWLPAALLLAPSALFLFAFTYWPVVRVLGQSFLVGRFAGQYRPGLGNYARPYVEQTALKPIA